jgi:hypothetical protein
LISAEIELHQIGFSAISPMNDAHAHDRENTRRDATPMPTSNQDLQIVLPRPMV